MVLDMSNPLGIRQEQDAQGTKDGEKGPAGKHDFAEPDPCSTSGLDPRPEMDVLQVVSQEREREREKILNPNLSVLTSSCRCPTHTCRAVWG